MKFPGILGLLSHEFKKKEGEEEEEEEKEEEEEEGEEEGGEGERKRGRGRERKKEGEGDCIPFFPLQLFPLWRGFESPDNLASPLLCESPWTSLFLFFFWNLV